MIKVEKIKIMNIEGAIRGMRNPLNSWTKSDSDYTEEPIYCKLDNGETIICDYILGENDKKLALDLVKAGKDHRKFLRQIFISMDITAPLCWWKDMDTYSVGVTKNSCSTMHKLGSKYLTKDDFSWDELTNWRKDYLVHINDLIDKWRENKCEYNFRLMIHDLLDSYNQKRTWTANYEVLRNIYYVRKTHKQREFREFCRILEDLPYGYFIYKYSNNEGIVTSYI